MYKIIYFRIPSKTLPWKQLECPSIGDWLNKLQDIAAMKYFAAKQKQGKRRGGKNTSFY